jgi:hypothetical protein
VLELARPPPTSGVRELEGPQEVGRLKYDIKNETSREKRGMATHLLEVGASGRDLVDEVLNTEDVVLAERLLDDSVVREGDALLVDLAVPALVDQLPDGFNIRLAGGACQFRFVSIVRPLVIYETDPYVMYGSMRRSICCVARVTLTNTPLLICRRRRSCMILRGLGAISLILMSMLTNKKIKR